MLVHCFWLLRFKFVVEFTCLYLFENAKELYFSPSPTLSLLRGTPLEVQRSRTMLFWPGMILIAQPSKERSGPEASGPVRPKTSSLFPVAKRLGPAIIPTSARTPSSSRTRACRAPELHPVPLAVDPQP
jgi:hypothetical protein